MGELIKRALTPTVGQNSLGKWLESPELSNPIVRQSTELQIVQEVLPFQTKRRYQTLIATIAGGDTGMSFQGTVPEDELWEIELLTIGHDSAVNRREWQMAVGHPSLMPTAQTVARVGILGGLTADDRAMPLVGGALFQVENDLLFNQPNGFVIGPDWRLSVQNSEPMLPGETAIFRMRYTLKPLPLDEELAASMIAVSL